MLSEDVLTVEEVAKYLRVPVDAIQVEIETGRLRAINIAGHIRVREFSLADYLNVARAKPAPETRQDHNGFRLNLHAVPNFTYKWPDGSEEPYADAAEGVATFEDVDYQVKIGFTIRQSAGKRRARSLVLVNRYPSVEFAAETDSLTSESKMASIIKDRNGKQLPVGAEIPPEYGAKAVGPYRSVVDGPGARNGMAVICQSSDLQTMIEHGVIRFRFRGDRE